MTVYYATGYLMPERLIGVLSSKDRASRVDRNDEVVSSRSIRE